MACRLFLAVLMCSGLLLFCATGCEKTPDKPVVANNDSTKQDAKNKYSGNHYHGPRGGEGFSWPEHNLYASMILKSGQNLIQVYTFDPGTDKELPIKADKLVASTKMGSEEKTFELMAVAPEAGMASRFEIENEDLAIAIKAADVMLEVEIDGKKESVMSPKPH